MKPSSGKSGSRRISASGAPSAGGSDAGVSDAGRSTPSSPSAGPPGSLSTAIPGARLIEMYRMMARLRKFEERCYQIYLQRKIGDSATSIPGRRLSPSA